MATTREMEIAQGLREPGGALIGGLHVEDYLQGRADYESGAEPPRVTSTSYDLGRRRAADDAEAEADLRAELRRREADGRARVEEALKGHPSLLAEYRARMASIAGGDAILSDPTKGEEAA